MAIRFYDKALIDKIRNWVVDKDIQILDPEDTEAFLSSIADQNKDKPIALPLISLKRLPSVNILNTNKQPLSAEGLVIKNVLDEQGKAQQLNAIPVSISYSLDIYTRYFAEADEYIRNFVFQLINSPKLTINIPYNNANLTHNSYIRLQNEIKDNSKGFGYMFTGQFTKMSIPFVLDDAYLFSSPVNSHWKVVTSVEVR